ncbi:hypothetical protein Closa_0932 [[Clostridium] saccharolyticum WM1]|uniref:Uncharacterized protein n=1 Tax=Lacrimispora saccharolytica (strain ATCC 35040 / DSM 2544 / NRCC 2533 / WM1) TaxID=610130 RepID=D9R6P5_LACSW|nr:hypothetical protein Closa_0932 [[Clostridium] saccharolyticum WM1]
MIFYHAVSAEGVPLGYQFKRARALSRLLALLCCIALLLTERNISGGRHALGYVGED